MPTLDVDGFTLKSWDELIAEGAVVRLRITSGEVAAALAKAGAADAALEVPLGKPDDLYTEVFFGLLTPAGIGGNVMGVRNFEDLRGAHPAGGQMIFMASNGPYDFHGTSHFWKADGYRFNRIRIVQDGRTIGFVHDDYQRLLSGAASGLQAQQMPGCSPCRPSAGLDPVKPWRLELVVNAAGQLPAAVLPARIQAAGRATSSCRRRRRSPAWVEAWRDARGRTSRSSPCCWRR